MKVVATVAIIAGVFAGVATPSAAGPPASSDVWQFVVPGVTGDPVSVYPGPASAAYADTFIRQGVRVVHHRFREGSSVVTDLGGIAKSDPAAAATADATFVFAIGADDAVWYRRIAADGVMTDWATLGGIARRNPVATVDEGVVRLYAIGTNDGVYTRSLTGEVWSPWTALGGIVTSDPDAWGGGVIARGLDGAVWRSIDGGAWASLGGFIVGDPTLWSSNVGATAPDGRLFLWGASGWVDTGGVAAAPGTLAAANVVGFHLRYLGRAPNGQVYVQDWGGRGRTSWRSLGGNAISRITGAVVSQEWCDFACSGELVYAVGVDGGLYQYQFGASPIPG